MVLVLLVALTGWHGSCTSSARHAAGNPETVGQVDRDSQQAGMAPANAESRSKGQADPELRPIAPLPGGAFQDAAAAGEIHIRNLESAGPVYADFISFSAVSAFNKHPETRRFIAQDPQGVELVQGLHPHAIRFPGGSFTRKFFPRDEKGKRLLDAYKQMANATGEKRCILVLNIYAGSQEDARFLIQDLRTAGIDIVAVELGNEYHIKKYRKKYPDAEAVVADLKPYVDLVKQELPGVPMGLPVPSSRHVFDAEQMGNRADFFEDWTTVLARAVRSGELDVQAVIPHFYKQTHEVFELPSTRARFDGVMDKMRIDSYAFLKQVVLDYYADQFGEGIEVWITEWGLKEKQVYGNTVAEGIHVMGFLMDMAEANRRTGNAIRHSCYQKLAGPVSNAAITPTGTLPTLENTGAFQPGTAWYAFHDIHPALQDARYVTANFTGVGQDQVRMACFRREGDLYVVFANRTGQYWRTDVAGRMTAVWGEQAWASNGQTFWNASGEYVPAQRIEDQLSNTIPPYGYGVIKADWDAVMAR